MMSLLIMQDLIKKGALEINSLYMSQPKQQLMHLDIKWSSQFPLVHSLLPLLIDLWNLLISK